MSIHLSDSAPLPSALTSSDLVKGKLYTVRCALRVQLCKERCLTGDIDGNTAVPLSREITNGTMLELHHHDTLSGFAFCTTNSGTALRVPANYLIPWN